MNPFRSLSVAVLLSLLTSFVAFAEPKQVRWTGADDVNGDFAHVLEVLRDKTGYQLYPADFTVGEERDLANHRFKMMLQNVGGVVTTLGSEGSILIQRGSDVLLHLIP